MRASLWVAIATVVVGLSTSAAGAQTWTSPRGRPPLWQIIALDKSGEKSWPFGAEDIAGDGAGKFEADEASADLRSVYADADRNRVWIRAYVAATGNASANLVTFFFIDTDENSETGGGADSTDLWPEFESDPSEGGYERAVGVRVDGMLIGAWRWDTAGKRWMVVTPTTGAIQIEVDRDQDPIRFAGNEHAYVQVALEHSISGLDASCNGDIFVRTWLETPPDRSFGDTLLGAAACRPDLDNGGDPDILPRECDEDADCPAGGKCREDICVWEYTCDSDADCRDGERCMGSICVKVVSGPCDGDEDCEGLVCDANMCVACTQSGNRACESGLVCTPNGTCIDPDDAAGGSGGSGGRPDGGGGSGATEYPPGKVRGGSFHCAAISGERGLGGWLYAAPVLALWLRRRRKARCS